MSSPSENQDQPPAPEPAPAEPAPLPPANATPADEFLKAVGLLDQLQPLYLLNQENQSSHPHFDELFKIIEADEPLLKAFRKFSNKGWFNSRIQVDSPYMAFTRYGTAGFYKITFAAFLANGIGELGTRFKIWPHLEKTARLSEQLAIEVAPQLAEDAFTVGLLHDALVAPMDRHIPEYLYYLECALTLDPVVTHLENQCHKFDHASLAADLATALGFEEHITEAVRHHHDQSIASFPNEKGQKLLALLHIVKRSQIFSRLQSKVKFETTAGKRFIQEIAAILNLTPAHVIHTIEELVADLKIREDAGEP